MDFRRRPIQKKIQLPNDLYAVRVPRIATLTDEELEIFGLPITTVNNGMHVRERDFISCMLNLRRLIEIYQNGYPIYLRDPKDMVKLYESLEEYIRSNGTEEFDPNKPLVINKPKDPVDEEWLSTIESFLNEIFRLNKGSLLQDQLDALAGMNFVFDGMTIGNANVNILSNTFDNSSFNVEHSALDTNIGHMYNYSTMPNINFNNIERKPARRSRYNKNAYTIGETNE